MSHHACCPRQASFSSTRLIYNGITATFVSFSRQETIYCDHKGVKVFCCIWWERERALDGTKTTFCNSSPDVMDGNGDENSFDYEVNHGDDDNHADHDDGILVQIGWRWCCRRPLWSPHVCYRHQAAHSPTLTPRTLKSQIQIQIQAVTYPPRPPNSEVANTNTNNQEKTNLNDL